MRIITKISLMAIAVVLAMPAGATLIGDTVHGSYEHVYAPGVNQFDSSWGSGSTAVVGAGAEFTYSMSGYYYIGADLSDTSLILTYQIIREGGSQVSQHTMSFTDLDWGPTEVISAFTLVSGPSASVFDITFTDDSLAVSLYPLDIYGPDTITFEFDIETGPGGDPPIPEPATLTLLSLGLVGLAYRSRRKS